MSAKTYGTLTKTFHWTTALLIFAIIPLGLIANGMSFDTDAQLARKAQLFSIHKTLGVAVFFVALLRIVWALTQPKPGPLHPERRAETLLAEVIHWLLYISLVVAPLSGWIHHAATAGFAPIWWPFGQDLPLVPKDESCAHLFGSLHWVLTKVMAAAIALHVAGALKHQFIDRDATLRRMWFTKSDVPDVAAHHSSILPPVLAGVVTAAAIGLGSILAGGSDHDMPTAATLAQVQSDWQVDTGSIAITVNQFGSDVVGRFEDWTAEITFDPDADANPGDVAVTIAIGSLTLGSVTSQAMGPDYFDATTFPTATFAGPIVATETGYQIAGTLTLKGAAVPVTLPFALDIAGDTATVSGETTVDRRDFVIGDPDGDESNLGFSVGIAVSLTATRQTN